MKKSIYIMGSIEIILGALLLSIISIIKNVLPILGRVAYQVAVKGSYSSDNYIISVPIATVIAVLLILVGIVQMIYSIVKNL